MMGITIRLGASHWDLTTNGQTFDFRAMTTAERKLVYGAFMDGVRKTYQSETNAKAQQRPAEQRRPSRSGSDSVRYH